MTRRPRHQVRCAACGLLFPAANLNAQYCSSACRVHAFRSRRQQALHATDPVLPLQWQEQAAPDHDCRIWHGTAIQRRQSDGYVNATAMCQAGDREWFTYARSARAQEYIQALAAHLEVAAELRLPSLGSPQNPATLIQSITTGPNELRGTWIHPRLAVDLARWISPAFAVWMDGWFLESLQPSSQPPQLPAQLPFGIHIVGRSRRECFHMISSYVRKEVISILNVTDRDLFGTIPNTPAPDYLHYPQRSHTD